MNFYPSEDISVLFLNASWQRLHRKEGKVRVLRKFPGVYAGPSSGVEDLVHEPGGLISIIKGTNAIIVFWQGP